jgi:hypothetical protein
MHTIVVWRLRHTGVTIRPFWPNLKGERTLGQFAILWGLIAKGCAIGKSGAADEEPHFSIKVIVEIVALTGGSGTTP